MSQESVGGTKEKEIAREQKAYFSSVLIYFFFLSFLFVCLFVLCFYGLLFPDT